ncbi:MAG: NADH-quinone oxidoreductase subunit J [Calditrichaeota bacterium]|nr:MAG: NADH-quinone oxidoreductase subunit J [Calditrichota bacterium]
MEHLLDIVIARFNYWIYIILMMIGLYGMIAKNNFAKKLIGMSIFQTAIILFYVSISVKQGGTIPIIDVHGAGHAAVHQEAAATPGESPAASETSPGAVPEIRAEDYVNPLPHVLMLTAIVVGVATLGVGLAVLQKIYYQYGSIEESEILQKIKEQDPQDGEGGPQ